MGGDSRRRRPPTYFVAGYFGFGVVGDEAILAAMTADLRAIHPGARLVVTSHSPAETASAHAVEAVGFEDVGALLACVQSSDVVLVGGGGVFNEYAPYRAGGLLSGRQDFNTFCADMPTVAWLLGKPCMIYAAGVEPLSTPVAREHVRLAFELADVATVRDEGSLRVLRSAGVSAARVRVTADPAARLRLVSGTDAEWIPGGLEPATVDRPARVGVSLRHWNTGRWDLAERANPWEAEVASALDTFLDGAEATVVFIPFQKQATWGEYGDDSRICARVRGQMRHAGRAVLVDRQLSCHEAAALLASCDMNLCMRFHSVVLSVSAGVPAVALGYSLKVRSAMRRAGLGRYMVPLEHLERGRLARALQACWKSRRRTSQAVTKVARAWRRAGRGNAEAAASLVGRGRRRPGPEDRARQACAALVVRQATTALRAGRMGSALRAAARALIDDGRNLPLAADLLEQAIDPLVPDAELTYLLAFCLHGSGRELQRAADLYTASLALGFDEFWVRYNRGSLLARQGRIPDAEADLERAASLQPEHEGTQQMLSRVRARAAAAGDAVPIR